MRVVAGIDVGNATTEVVLLSDGDGKPLAAGRVPTRGPKGSPDSLRAAAALVRRLERQAGCQVSEARIAPLRPVETLLLTVPDVPQSTGRLHLVAAGVPTPGGTGTCVGVPLRQGTIRHDDSNPLAIVAVVAEGTGYREAAAWVRELLATGVPVGAVLVAGDDGVLIANRVAVPVPVIDQVDVAAAAQCALLAVEVCPPGQAMRLLTDPVALAARLGLAQDEAAAAAVLCRSLAGRPNAVVGLRADAGSMAPATRSSGIHGANGTLAGAGGAGGEPWVGLADGRRYLLRDACGELAGWPPGTVRRVGAPDGAGEVDDLFAVDLAEVAEAATARRGSTGRAVLAAALRQHDTIGGATDAARLAGLLGIAVTSPLTEPAAARLGALTTPGARDDALIIDLGAGTIDVIGPDGDVVAAGAGDLLTAAVAELLGIPRAMADWVKRGPCVRIDGGQRFEAEDGARGFLDAPAPAQAVGMLAVHGPGGWLPFDRRHAPGEWRALRLRSKTAVMTANAGRAVRTLGAAASQVIVVGGPAGDDELPGILAGVFPGDVPVGRGHVAGMESLAHRYAVALGLALARC